MYPADYMCLPGDNPVNSLGLDFTFRGLRIFNTLPSSASDIQPTLNPTKMAEKSALLALPGEIRNRIYRLVLVGQEPVDVYDQGVPEPGVLFIRKQIRNEGVRLFYTENQFRIRLD